MKQSLENLHSNNGTELFCVESENLKHAAHSVKTVPGAQTLSASRENFRSPEEKQ